MLCYVQFTSVDGGRVGLSQFGNSACTAGMSISFSKDNLDSLKANWIEKKRNGGRGYCNVFIVLLYYEIYYVG